ncbi:hypothetical protein LshimejAT787_1101510 [Lyophyllum shimeji]|uniref:Uncharacterized protein n=1 Tax=Lyophyllum shimeji TaxID=47721 RepID=A0A9P3PVT7_LYOSH|nr:hypothetical protein LshimejAT787_1101510 [Lyophyllum shimeji]
MSDVVKGSVLRHPETASDIPQGARHFLRRLTSVYPSYQHSSTSNPKTYGSANFCLYRCWTRLPTRAAAGSDDRSSVQQ